MTISRKKNISNKSNFDVSILILVRNEEGNIKKCLRQVFNQRTNFRYEVIVVDSGSTDQTVEICKTFPVKLVCIQPDKFSHSGTRNLAARLSKGKYLVYLAGDAIPCNERWLDYLINSLTEDDRVAAVYGRQIPKADLSPNHKFRLNWLYGQKRLVKDYEQRHKLPNFYFFSTVNCAIKKFLWNKLMFNENLRIFEDMEFASRVMRLGYLIVYEPNAKVFHGHNIGVLETLKRYFVIGTTLSYLGISDELKKSFGGEGIAYTVKEIYYLLTNGYIYFIPYSILHDLAKSIGLFLGMKKNLLP
ncbi:TPA: glycosyltransferase, partial [Candidatus Bathyarchaeota archaeon]|nr:glycosyltransferase [Candidatus Bathyarchaeota archaeon]